MSTEKRHCLTIRPTKELHLKALETMDLRGMKQFTNYIYTLIEEDYKRVNENNKMEQLINILLEGKEKDLEGFIKANNINISPKEYWDLLQKIDNKGV